MGVGNAEIAGLMARRMKLRCAGGTAARKLAFDTFGFKFKLGLNAKFADRARSLDRRTLCLNPVTNRKYMKGDKGLVRISFRPAGKGMNAMLAASAAPIVTLDSVEGRPVVASGGQETSRRDAIVAPHETQLVSGDCLNQARSGSFAAPGALSLSAIAGQREYHAEF